MKLTAQKNQEFLDKGIMPFTMIQFTVEKEDSMNLASTGNYMVQ